MCVRGLRNMKVSEHSACYISPLHEQTDHYHGLILNVSLGTIGYNSNAYFNVAICCKLLVVWQNDQKNDPCCMYDVSDFSIR